MTCLLGLQFKAVKPVGDRLLVKIDQGEPKSTGGVLLPTAAQSKQTAGSIVAAGDVQLVKVSGMHSTVVQRQTEGFTSYRLTANMSTYSRWHAEYGECSWDRYCFLHQ